jgi:lysophospholipase L1-like esterase
LGAQIRRSIPFLLVGSFLWGGCSSSPTTPTPPPTIPEAPKISCPAPVNLQSSTGQPLPVVYGTATSVGGVAPITISCTPASGTQFAIGTTAVSCTAADSRQRTDTCNFAVTVQAPARISLTRFVAFGDSITLGEDGTDPTAVPMLRPFIVLVGREYPTVLLQQLAFRYTSQAIQLVNEGNRGEYAGLPTTLTRFRQVMATRAPEAVLIMEGTNDLFDVDPLDIPPAITNLRVMIREARNRGARPYLATVPPMNPLGLRGGGWSLVPTLNDQIRFAASQEGVTLVDVNQAFGGNLSLLSADGLHPNAAGYAVIAETFFQTLRATLEVTAALTSTRSAPLVPARH